MFRQLEERYGQNLLHSCTNIHASFGYLRARSKARNSQDKSIRIRANIYTQSYECSECTIIVSSVASATRTGMGSANPLESRAKAIGNGRLFLLRLGSGNSATFRCRMRSAPRRTGCSTFTPLSFPSPPDVDSAEREFLVNVGTLDVCYTHRSALCCIDDRPWPIEF